MRAIVIESPGNMVLREVEAPQPGYGQARVRVRACGVNRADLLQVRGLYPAPKDAPADIPGLEVAGEVDAVGPGVIDVRVGDRVYGVVSGGAYAEHVVVHARTLALIPKVDGKPLAFTEAAAIPEAFVTAYDAMVLQCGLAAGETVLIHAVASGVGLAALQVARAVGAIPIGTSRTQQKLRRVESFGLAAGIVPESHADGTPRFAECVRDNNGGKGVDVVLELVGGAYVPESLASLAERGRLVLVGLTAGPRAELDLGIVLRHRLRLVGTVLRSRPLEEKITAARVLAKNISPLVADKKFSATLHEVLPLEEAAKAHEIVARNDNIGKVVLAL